MSVTINDVAELANVSIASVSRVVNGNYPVTKETRERVQQAIKTLNYIPNQQARSLSLRKSDVIGIITPSINNMFFTEIISAAEKELKNAGYSILLYSFHHERNQEQKGVTDLISHNVAGVIALDPGNHRMKSFYTKISKQIPLVFVNGEYIGGNISYIYNDEQQGALLGLRHLYALGRKRIVFLRGGASYSYDIKETVYHHFVKQHGFTDVVLSIDGGNGVNTVQRAMDIVKKELTTSTFDAIFACNDLMALGCVNACKEAGYMIPDDIAVVGFDNTPLASYVTPNITSIDQNMKDLGAGAAQLILDKIQGQNKRSKRMILNNQLCIKESTDRENRQ